MGMYTELVIKFAFKPDELDQVSNEVLSYLFNPNSKFEDKDNIVELPNHAFFKYSRWDNIGHCSSYYHHPNNVMDWYRPDYAGDTVYVFNRSDLKDYDDEIDLFVDWLRTLKLDTIKGEFIGYKRYEEDDSPTPLYL